MKPLVGTALRHSLVSLLILLAAFFVACGGMHSSSAGVNNPAAPNGSTNPETSTPAPAPQVTQFTTSSASVNLNQSITLTWSSANATSVTITAVAASGGSPRTVVTSSQASGSFNDPVSDNTTYTCIASGPGGSSTPVTAKVQVNPPKISQFTASPATVNSGQTTTLTWQTTNATSVSITPDPQAGNDDAPPLGTSSSVVTSVTSTTKFTLVASGPGGSATQTATVAVPIALSFTASPSTVTAGSGQQITLSWQVSNGSAATLSIDHSVCSSCTLPQGTWTGPAPAATTTYTATATDTLGNKVTQKATVVVNAAPAGPIKHIFFMLQENISFDHYFGKLGSYRTSRLAQFGIQDSQTVDGFDPNVTLVSSYNGVSAQPYHLQTACSGEVNIGWDISHHDFALQGGDSGWNTTNTFGPQSFGMSGFLDMSYIDRTNDPEGVLPMAYYTQDDLPYYYDLATFFATSDAWYSPLPSLTVPNRMYLMAATSFGHVLPDGDPNHPKYSAKTLFRAMNENNVSWLYYYNPYIFLANFQDFFDPAIQSRTFRITDLYNRLQGSCSGTPCDPDKALPQVIFIENTPGLDEHPDRNVQDGAQYVQNIITLLMNSDAWKDSVFILTYDEGGGWYDHTPPVMVPVPDQYAPGQCPDPNNGSYGYCTVGSIGGTFNLTGQRVPLLVISPYTKPHFVSHTPRDYTAILSFIENTFHIPSLTARDAYWRDPSRDMSEFFDFSSPALLNAPGGQSWTQFLPTQPTTEVCDLSKETIR